jgi:hypothetical protein
MKMDDLNFIELAGDVKVAFIGRRNVTRITVWTENCVPSCKTKTRHYLIK